MNLLDEIPHDEKLVIIGHSQGGLYASEFCGLYPEMVKGLILLDPLTTEDNRFKKELTAKEFKKSGVDKSKNFIFLETLTKLGMKGFVKKVMCQAPPFAARIEQLWQEIMKEYLGYSKRAIWIQAKKSTHYIHLTEPEIVIESVNTLNN